MLLCIVLETSAQKSSMVTYSAEFGAIFSTAKRTPFWIKNNQFGVLPDSSNTTFFIHQLVLKDTLSKFLSWNAGLEADAIVGRETGMILPEVYGELKIGKLRLLAGRKKQIHGFGDSTLSSGSITWSGNSLPIPEVQISIPEYINFFQSRIGFKGHYSHGWFGNQAFAKDYFLHQKAFYVRLGKPIAKLTLYGGFIHNVQWGGKPKFAIPEDKWLTINQQFASGWNVYRDIVFPFNNPPRDSAKVATFDFENRYGNHLGQIDLGAEVHGEYLKWMLYKQLPFETGQTFSSLGNLDDGLYGVALITKNKNAAIKKVVFEFLHTTNQGLYRSGFLRLIGFKGKHYGRNQNFIFSHAQYRDGWSYEGKTIGSPFLLPTPEIRDEKTSEYNILFGNNNNIKAGYVGILSEISEVTLETRISLSKNFGSPANIFKESATQLSFVQKLAIPLPENSGIIHVEVGIDQGDLIRDNYGIRCSYKKVW